MNRNSLIAQYESYKWAMEPTLLKGFFERVAALPDSQLVTDISIAAAPREIRIEGSTAVVAISGVLLKTVPSWVRFWGIAATGYDEIRQMIGHAAGSKAVERIHLQIDSPGGQVDGLIEAADAIFAARRDKTVTATIEDLGASAAYWLASQAETIDAGRNTEVGSIGVYTVYVDFTKAAADAGAKVIVIRSGEHKGMGVMGAEITDEQIAAVQDVIDAIAENFISAVAAGRGKEVEDIRELATGRLWIAEAARELGLIDAVTYPPAAEPGADGNTGQQSSDIKSTTQGDNLMEEQEKIDQAVAKTAEGERGRLADIKTACDGDLEFAVAAWERGLSGLEAKAEYADVLREKLTASEKQHAESRQADGAEAMATGDTDAAAGGDFIAEVRDLAEEKDIPKTEAMRRIKRRKPELYADFQRQCETRGRQMYAEAV